MTDTTALQAATEQPGEDDLPPYTCNGCTNRWSGTSTAHCHACHHTFSGVTTFDAHRTAAFRCLPPAAVKGLVDAGRAYPCWGTKSEPKGAQE